MRILLTGATGFLGRVLTRTLLLQGHQVVALSRRSDQPLDLAAGVEALPYTAQGAAAALERGPVDAVVHAACAYDRDGITPAELVEANLSRPLEVALACGTRIGRWVNLGTGLPPATSGNALAKDQFAQWLAYLPPSQLAPRVNLRLQHFYGPGDSPRKFPTLVARACLRRETLDLTAGTQRRDFLYVDDAATAIQVACEAGLDGNWSQVDVGSGSAPTVRDFCERIQALAGGGELHFGARPFRPSEPSLCVADTGALERWGWRPRVGLDEGLRRLVDAEREAMTGGGQP